MILSIVLFIFLFLFYAYQKRLWTLVALAPIALLSFSMTEGSWFSVFVVANIYFLMMLFPGGDSRAHSRMDGSWSSSGNGWFGGGSDGGGGSGGGGE